MTHMTAVSYGRVGEFEASFLGSSFERMPIKGANWRTNCFLQAETLPLSGTLRPGSGRESTGLERWRVWRDRLDRTHAHAHVFHSAQFQNSPTLQPSIFNEFHRHQIRNLTRNSLSPLTVYGSFPVNRQTSGNGHPGVCESVGRKIRVGLFLRLM